MILSEIGDGIVPITSALRWSAVADLLIQVLYQIDVHLPSPSLALCLGEQAQRGYYIG